MCVREEQMRQTRKYVIYAAAVVLLAAVCLSGCDKTISTADIIGAFQEDEQTNEQVMDEEILAENTEEIAQQPVTEEKIDIDDLDEVCQIILEYCTKEFIGYHLIDETFLAWFGREYGNECLVQVADEVLYDSQDKDIWYELTGNSIQVLWLLYCEQTGFQQYQLDNVKWQVCASAAETTLAFTGDVNFSEGYVTTKHMDSCPDGIYDCFSEDLLDIMNGVDVMLVNNEFTYSTRGTALRGKAYTFRADPSRVKLLEVFGTDIVNLANNHVYDYGEDALLDTIATLDEAGIPHIGAGANLEEAKKPYYFICNGRKIAIVAATQIERTYNYTKEATDTTPGVLKTLEPDKFVEVIREAKKNSDYVIAFVHWGTEGDSNYGRDQTNLAKAFVNAGADAIIGGHTHCLQGFDMIEDVPVIYSLGNFWFSSSTQDTGLAEITIDEKGELTLGFIPCIQEKVKTSLVTDEAEKQRILEFMRTHSAKGVTVTSDGIVQKEEE